MDLNKSSHGLRETTPCFLFPVFPAVSVTSGNIFGLAERILHTEHDTPDLIDTNKLEALVNFLHTLLCSGSIEQIL